MPAPADNTPVIIAVGQASERLGDGGYRALSPMDLAGQALAAAIADAKARGNLAGAIDTLCSIRQFENSTPRSVPPFGMADNPPRAIARRVGANPARAILEVTGGQGPQAMLGELATEIAEGRSECAAIVGAEAMSSVLTLLEAGETPDWSETVGGSLEDRGYAIDDMFERALVKHGAGAPIPAYAMFDNARRARLGQTLEEYRHAIGTLFAPFTHVAAANPHAAAPVQRSVEELARVTDRNRIVAEPYTRMTVARDKVNQAAAIVLASVAQARALGVPEERWVYVHAATTGKELPVLARPDLARSPASIASVEAALEIAGKSIAQIDAIDFYSCFAIPVFNQLDHFGLAVDDPRGFTLTGGLPFFGAAGNDYSAHAIAEAVQRARSAPGSFALVGANGGVMSKYATGIYSTMPAEWNGRGRTRALSQAEDRVAVARDFAGQAVVETYTLMPGRGGDIAVVIGRNDAGERVIANADLGHGATRASIESGEPFGARMMIRQIAPEQFAARIAS
ncbi:acetyl-CoA acetyltransferase [Altererythrobacter sp. CAU 1778]